MRIMKIYYVIIVPAFQLYLRAFFFNKNNNGLLFYIFFKKALRPLL